LKPSYFRQAVNNCANVQAVGWGEDTQEELFQGDPIEAAR